MSQRFSYVKYDDYAAKSQQEIKVAFEKVEALCEQLLSSGRAKALVMTKLEEAYMWTGKSIRDSQIERNFGEYKELEERSAE